MEAASSISTRRSSTAASIAAFGRPFMKGGLINRRLVARAAVSQLIYLYFGADEDRLVRVRESMLAITKGWDRAQVRQIVRETMLADDRADHVRRGARADGGAPGRPAIGLLGLGLTRGDRAALGRPARGGRRICSAARWTSGAATRARMAFYAYGEKAWAMRELAERTGLDLSASSAYSDSATDLPDARGGRPSRGGEPDRALAKVARERGWEMRNFTKPIRRRDPVRAHHPGGDDQPRRGRCRADPCGAAAAESRHAGRARLAGRAAENSAVRGEPGPLPGSVYASRRRSSGDDADEQSGFEDQQLLHGPILCDAAGVLTPGRPGGLRR